MAESRNYSAGRFMLMIGGQPAGILTSVEGGEPFAAVVNEAADTSGLVQKHLGVLEFAPIRISFGTGMSKALYDWMAEFLNRTGSARSGAIAFLDYNNREKSRLEFDDALITELAFPAVDAASKDAARFYLMLQPGATRINTASIGTNVPGFGKASTKVFTAAFFRLKIAELEVACSKVNRIDSIIVKQTMTQNAGGLTPGVMNIPNVTFTLPESQAKGFEDWFRDFVLKGDNAEENERRGTLEFLDPSMKTSQFTLALSSLGICRMQKERSEANLGVMTRVRVELYCEEIAFSNDVTSEGSIVAPAASNNPPAASPTNSNSASPADGPGIRRGRSVGEEALPAMLRVGNSTAITSSNFTAQPQLIAQRLLATVRPREASPLVPKRDDGILIGERWAAEKATLQELEQVAALESGDWTAMKLEGEHSLIVHLTEAGVLPSGGDGPLDLERDNFVEGIVTGASRVLRSAIPHLSPPAEDK